MLANTDAVANLAVKNLGRAKQFYEGVLGLTPVHEMGEEVIVYRSGATSINVYRSEHAGTNKATAVTWNVADVDATVRQLKAKGVTFERYDMPGTRHEGDVHVAEDGGMRVAWFKDPDGNILNLFSD
jgi:catechol 2,3-dioxygenase-like lactoylglutathione lyase family enzyme